jgi:pyruvate dehydrogenase E1 component
VFEGKRIESYVAAQLGADIPAVAATDYVCAYAEQIRPHIQCPYHVLGTDGFGRSDTRSNLRKFFGVDAQTIVYQSVWQLVEQNKADPKLLQKLRTQLDAVLVQQNPTQV